MRSEGDWWDPCTVIGLKAIDEVLVFGNSAFMPWIAEVCHDVTSARRFSEIKALLRDGEQFDKIIVAREMAADAETISLLGPLVRKGPSESGVLAIFPPDDGWSAERAIEFYYPEASVVTTESTFGLVVMASPNGVSWRFYNV